MAKATKDAAEALDWPERAELEKAEAEAKSHARLLTGSMTGSQLIDWTVAGACAYGRQQGTPVPDKDTIEKR